MQSLCNIKLIPKNRGVIALICLVGAFSFNIVVWADNPVDVVITQPPRASSIIYGESLASSILTGGLFTGQKWKLSKITDGWWQTPTDPFINPSGLALDADGNIYVADSWFHEISKVTPGVEIMHLVSGGEYTGSPFYLYEGSFADGNNGVARFDNPRGIAFEIYDHNEIFGSSLNIFVADSGNNRIRLLRWKAVRDYSEQVLEWLVTTLAGSGSAGFADGTGMVARFNHPSGVALDTSSNLYVADTGNNRVRKINSAGVVTTLAGSGATGVADGLGTSAQFNGPEDVAVDSSGNVYVADTGNNRIRKINLASGVTTLAGGGLGSLVPIEFNSPNDVAVDTAGNVYVADTGKNRICKVTSDGVLTTLAGSDQAGFSDGNGTVAKFRSPEGVAVDASGNVYVADTYNNRIRKINSAGVVTTLAGSGAAGFADGTGTEAKFYWPKDVAVDQSGNVYVADYFNHAIRLVTSAGQVTTPAPAPTNESYWEYLMSQLYYSWYPEVVALDAPGNVYVKAGRGFFKLRSNGLMPLSYLGVEYGYTFKEEDDPASIPFKGPFGEVWFYDLTGIRGLAVDASGNVYVSESRDETVTGDPGVLRNRIRKVVLGDFGYSTSGYRFDGKVKTLVGKFGYDAMGKNIPAGFSDGKGAEARFNNPCGLAVDASGNVYVADKGNNRVRKVTPDGVVTTLGARQGLGEMVVNPQGFSDGTGTEAQFNNPTGLAVDASGNVYVADKGNKAIRLVTPAGKVTTLSVEDTDKSRWPFLIEDIAVDAFGNVYGGDIANHQIVKLTPEGGTFAFTYPTIKPSSGSSLQSVTFTPTDTVKYKAVTISVMVTVNKATPAISIIPTASAITDGQTLARSTLRGGTASVAGRFNWSVPSTVPSFGTTSQEVTFTPMDTANYNTATTSVSVVVNPAITSNLSAVTITLGANYSYQITGSGSPTSFGAIGLPPGLKLNAKTGLISGRPTRAGIFSVTLQAMKKGATTATATKVFTVVQVPTFSYPARINAQRNKNVNVRPKVAGSPAPSFSVVSGSLPPGLSLNASTAAITGTPTAVGSYPFTVRGSNSAGNTDRSTTIVVK